MRILFMNIKCRLISRSDSYNLTHNHLYSHLKSKNLKINLPIALHEGTWSFNLRKENGLMD
jgi:hypothetical protein